MSVGRLKAILGGAGLALAVALGLLTVLGGARGLAAEIADPWLSAGRLLVGAAILLGAVLAVLVMMRAHGHPGARPLALFLLALPLAGGAEYYGDLLSWVRPESVLGAGAWIAYMLAVGALVTFSMAFPRPLAAVDMEAGSPGPVRTLRALVFRIRTYLVPVLAVVGLAVVVLALIEESDRLYEAVHPWEVFLLGLPVTAVLYLLMFGALANLKLGYRLSDPGARRSVFWVLEGVLLTCIVFVFHFAAGFYAGASGSHPPEFLNVVAPMLFMAALLCFAFALLYHGGLDPELLVRRTTVYGLAGILLTAVFATTQFAAERLVAGDGGRAAWLVSVGVALLLSPLYRKAERRVEALLAPREGMDPAPSARPSYERE